MQHLVEKLSTQPKLTRSCHPAHQGRCHLSRAQEPRLHSTPKKALLVAATVINVGGSADCI